VGSTGPAERLATFRCVRIRPLLACVLTATTLVGCTADPEPEVGPVAEPTEEAEPAPPPPPADVAGELAEVTVNDLSRTETGLYRAGSGPDAPVPVDEAAVDASVAAAVAWVDAHLTDVQSGGSGHVGDVGLTGDDATVASGLTNPDHPVTSVTYRATVGALGDPEWIRLSTAVQREDGEGTATFVFLPAGAGEVVLLAAQVGDGTPAPPAAPPEDDADEGGTEEDA
jgi:hypothetical protein